MPPQPQAESEAQRRERLEANELRQRYEQLGARILRAKIDLDTADSDDDEKIKNLQELIRELVSYQKRFGQSVLIHTGEVQDDLFA